MQEPKHRWYKHYPSYIPHEINISSYRSLSDLLQQCVREFSDHKAFYHLGSTLSFTQLDHLSQHFSSILQQKYKIQKGDRIALMLPNILPHPICMFGALRAGGVLVNINPLYTPGELKEQLNDSGARHIIILDTFTRTLAKIIHETSLEQVIICRVGDLHKPSKRMLINFVARYIKKLKPDENLSGDSFHELINQVCDMKEDVEVSQEDLAFLQYTGGTTGTSKGTMLTHRNILANSQQAYDWISPAFKTLRPHVITALPLYHIFALLANGFVVMRLGGCSHLITNPRDMKSFLKELSKVKFHAITGVNTLFNTMLNHRYFRKLSFENLKLTLAGGMSAQRPVADEWHEKTGCPIIEAYGLTEASPAVTANLVSVSHYTGTIGLPLPSTEVSIRDNNGQEVASNIEGELWARGPQIMKGYWNRAEETRQTLTEDGWLKTGDIAVMGQDGYIRLVDRKKDMVIISGFNVYPNEIEDILTRHPDILEAGVIGVPHIESGEAVKAVIVRKNKKLTEDAVIKYCRQHLTAYKVPKIIEFQHELPKTNVGKIMRRALR